MIKITAIIIENLKFVGAMQCARQLILIIYSVPNITLLSECDGDRQNAWPVLIVIDWSEASSERLHFPNLFLLGGAH